MAERVVISRTSRAERMSSKDFNFSRKHSAVLDGIVDAPAFLKSYRENSWEAFNQLSLPATDQEAWRRTDLRDLRPGNLILSDEADLSQMRLAPPPAELLKPLVSDAHGGQIEIGAGSIRRVLDPEISGLGVVFTDLATAEKEHPQVLEKILGKVVRPEEGKFAALVGALASNGILVYVPRGVQLDQPLHSVLWGAGVNLAYLSHILVYVDEGASLTYVHEAASETEASGQSLHAGIVEIHISKGAHLRFVELQSWGEHVWNFSHERIEVDGDGTLDWIFGAIGSHLTKNFSEINLIGRGASGRMSGFYFTDGVQHLDHDTQQNHLAPNTTSDLLFKGALRDQSRSVWQGMIYVAPGAQKTDGYQANRNLVLSRQARADSIPGLEILADDVRCTHGATVGKIDPDQLFYLRSRGIAQQDAERLIVEGFFDPIMQRIPFEGVRERFKIAIEEKMG